MRPVRLSVLAAEPAEEIREDRREAPEPCWRRLERECENGACRCVVGWAEWRCEW